MKVTTKKSLLIGAASGIGFALVIALVSLLNNGGNETLQSIINFFGCTAAFFVMDYNLSEFVGIIIFFVYWALVGGIFGLLLSQRSLKRYILIFSFIVILIVGHRMLQIKLENSIERIGHAFERLLDNISIKGGSENGR